MFPRLEARRGSGAFGTQLADCNILALPFMSMKSTRRVLALSSDGVRQKFMSPNHKLRVEETRNVPKKELRNRRDSRRVVKSTHEKQEIPNMIKFVAVRLSFGMFY